MTEGQDMAPSKAWRRSVEGRGSDAVSNYLLPRASIERRDGSISASDAFGIKKSRDGDGNKDGNKDGGKGDGNGGDKNKGNNKSDDDKGNGGGNNNSNNNQNNGSNNNNFNNNPNNNQDDDTFTTPGFEIPTSTPGFPPLAVPVASLVTTSSPPAVTTTKTSTSIATATSTRPVTSVIETTSVVTSVQMATMTTTIPVMATVIPPVTISSQPRKGVDGPGGDSTLPFPVLGSPTATVTATDTTATVTATAIADSLDGSDNNSNNSGNNTKGSGGHGKKDSNDPPPGALDQGAEHALIAVGSIGAFVLICFVGWVIYRTLKKSRRGQFMSSGNGGFIDRLPWRRNQNNDMWNDRNAYMSNDMPPPMYEKGSHNSMQEAGFYGAEKMYQQPQPGLTRSNTAGSQRSMLPQLAPGSVIMIPAEQYMAMSQAQSPVGSDQTSTMRSRMPDAFFNQSELARQPSDAYDPARRQVNRASELSSLSSGFGDGDIIIPEEYLNKPQPAASQLRQSNNFITRFSWMSRREAGDRETVYTTTSEDRPAKYRSVGSWVNQQTGRIKRADERQQEVPPVPELPPNLDSQGPR